MKSGLRHFSEKSTKRSPKWLLFAMLDLRMKSRHCRNAEGIIIGLKRSIDEGNDSHSSEKEIESSLEMCDHIIDNRDMSIEDQCKEAFEAIYKNQRFCFAKYNMSIPIVYFRSSSFNSHRMCPMQYYMEYTLGWRGKSGKKADKGTIVHKILEISAFAKKGLQDGHKTFQDSKIGKVETANYDPSYLNEIIDKVYEYYTSRTPHHKWLPLDLKHCRKWVWKIFEDHDGMFDPKNRLVVDAEPHFDFEIEEDWAAYKYELDDGTVLEGNLSLKGTIDLINRCGR